MALDITLGYAYTVMSLMVFTFTKRGPRSEIKGAPKQSAIGRERCLRIPCCDDDRWMDHSPERGALSEFDAICIHRIVLTVPKAAAVLSREWIQAFKKNWGAHVVISKRIQESG